MNGLNLKLMTIYNKIEQSKSEGKKMLSLLIDPGKFDLKNTIRTIKQANDVHVDYFFIGGSLVQEKHTADIVHAIKSYSNIPCLIFPGSVNQIDLSADALLYLSLISGRNPELLIGKHVECATMLHKSGLEIIPTGYMLIESGNLTSVHYLSNTIPIPKDKTDIAVSTALAGQLLGLKLIYLEAGSGAKYHVGCHMVEAVSKVISMPLIVGGGIRSAETAKSILEAGADMIVIGNSVEKDPNILVDISLVVHSYNQKVCK
jgi:putative glycerol-1-phosphate prenyltransferase